MTGLHRVSTAALLFGESAGRFLVEVAPGPLRRLLPPAGQDCPFGEVGKLTATARLVVRGLNRKTVLDGGIDRAQEGVARDVQLVTVRHWV